MSQLTDEQYQALWDMRKQRVSELANKETLTPEEMGFAYQLAQNEGYQDDEVEDGLAELYAKYIRNYLYTYKDKAKALDPSIDPNEEHVGPMAQDIEKVAPDCVKETEDGTKVVDGNRLALVNSGVIADIVRRLDDLETRLFGGKSQ